MNITVLASGKPSLCKRFFKDGDVVRSNKAEMSSYFKYESKEVNGIEEFASLLTALEQDRSRFIIRGQLADDVDADTPMRRRLYRSDRSEPNEFPFLDVPASWVMIDVDKLALPKTFNWGSTPFPWTVLKRSQIPDRAWPLYDACAGYGIAQCN